MLFTWLCYCMRNICAHNKFIFILEVQGYPRLYIVLIDIEFLIRIREFPILVYYSTEWFRKVFIDFHKVALVMLIFALHHKKLVRP